MSNSGLDVSGAAGTASAGIQCAPRSIGIGSRKMPHAGEPGRYTSPLALTGSRRLLTGKRGAHSIFWKTTPYKVVFGCASCPKTRRNWLRLPIVRFHPGSSCPSSRSEASHTRGRRPPPFPRDSRVSWHMVNLRSAASSAIIRTSEHFHVFSPPPRLSVRMFGSGGKKRANASSNCAAL